MVAYSGTAVDPCVEEGILSSSILGILQVYNIEEPSSYGIHPTYEQPNQWIDPNPILIYLRKNAAPRIPYSWCLWRSIMSSSSDKLQDVIYGLLTYPHVQKVINYKKGNLIKIWVVSNELSVKTSRQYCNYFARKRNTLDDDLIFDFRIIGPDSWELREIPSDARVHGKG